MDERRRKILKRSSEEINGRIKKAGNKGNFCFLCIFFFCSIFVFPLHLLFYSYTFIPSLKIWSYLSISFSANLLSFFHFFIIFILTFFISLLIVMLLANLSFPFLSLLLSLSSNYLSFALFSLYSSL